MAYYSYFVYTNYIGTVWEDVTTVDFIIGLYCSHGLLVINHTVKLSIYCLFCLFFLLFNDYSCLGDINVLEPLKFGCISKNS